MSLPPLIKYVYNHGTEEVIRRGKRIFSTAGVQLVNVDHVLEQVRFRVKNDVYQNHYNVIISNFSANSELAVRCQCPYNMGEICRHEVAALFQLNEIQNTGFFEKDNIKYNQKHTVVRMKQINRRMIQLFASQQSVEEAEFLMQTAKVKLVSNKNDRIDAEVTVDGKIFAVSLKQNEERFFDTSCVCDAESHPLCIHKAAVFLQVLKTYGNEYFQNVQSIDIQKNKLLEQYGYTVKDNLSNKFSFTYDSGKVYLRVLDPTIKKLGVYLPSASATPQKSQPVERKIVEDKKFGIVFDLSVTEFPYVSVELVYGKTNEVADTFIDGITKMEQNQFSGIEYYKDDDKELIQTVKKFHNEEIVKFLKRNLPFGDFFNEKEGVFASYPETAVREQIWEYLLPKYKKLLYNYSGGSLIFIRNKNKLLSSAGIEKIELSDKPVHPQLIAKRNGSEYLVDLEWIVDNVSVPFGSVKIINEALVMTNQCLYSINALEEVQVIEQFMPTGFISLNFDQWNIFLKEKIMHWNNHVHVHFSEELIERHLFTNPEYKLYISEYNTCLNLKPVFIYDGIEVKPTSAGDILVPENGVVKILKRNESIEEEFMQDFYRLHKEFQYNKKEHIFSLYENFVLSNNWFSKFMSLMKDWKVTIVGYEDLKGLKININAPVTQIRIGSGIDWFDTIIEIKFGDNIVNASEIKKALSNKQNFVRLKDGSAGVLPDDWIKKYALLLKVGETKGNKVRLKKFHFSVMDELLTELSDATTIEGRETLHEELRAKKERLNTILNNDVALVMPPEHLKTVLRPYQLAGFHWIKFLNEAGWGGILADDMGLGKTVQTLAFFQHYKNVHQTCQFLVVCPTTLMYNWENEIKKFTPSLTWAVHHGSKRNSSLNNFQNFDIVITTYGTMRSDIKFLKEIPFDYVVLDESQSIKNPQSQVARASLLLNSKFRLALSGTPVQNNTFDLYAQMNFLNPGMLGSREFFMSEFATPIDKFREEEVKFQLKKLTYPFVLRRSKEQVAKDLPEKTETILFCEMGAEQRKIYETFRSIYRSQILGMIETRGMEKSQMHILQGLTKLRQICDSPAILNEQIKYHNHSIKLDELAREINENIGEHKALVFSQFLGMLALIREKLEEFNIPFVYFDGSSSGAEREKAIKEFQENSVCRVFLISLKAGGLGLNLTAADYVYIIDPWWNPAVEQQAIDRTHRIGQQKNIFAYRLICKDTLEEKMLQLQDSKRILAHDLISEDSSLMKKLTKDDIAFLFS